MLPMGGFSGQALEPALARIRRLADSGRLRFFQLVNGVWDATSTVRVLTRSPRRRTPGTAHRMSGSEPSPPHVLESELRPGGSVRGRCCWYYSTQPDARPSAWPIPGLSAGQDARVIMGFGRYRPEFLVGRCCQRAGCARIPAFGMGQQTLDRGPGEGGESDQGVGVA